MADRGRDGYPVVAGTNKGLGGWFKTTFGWGVSNPRSSEPQTPVVAGKQNPPASLEPKYPTVVGTGTGGENTKDQPPTT